MTGLGLRFCPNHTDEPLMLHQTRAGIYWRCEHESNCTHTEPAIRISTRPGVVAVNGKDVGSGGFRSGRKGAPDNGADSKVEHAVANTFKNRARRRRETEGTS